MARCAPTYWTGYNAGPCGPAPCTGECRRVEPATFYADLHEGYGDEINDYYDQS